MSAAQELSIEVVYEKHDDGRYYLRSSDLPGFRLEGSDWDALQADLNEVVSDLLLHNSNFVVEGLRWVPSPQDLKRHLEKPGPDGKARYVATGKIAA